MPYQHQLATGIAQLLARHLSGQRTLPGLDRTVLRAYRQRNALQALDNLTEVDTDREHRNRDISRQRLPIQTIDQLCDTGAGTVHFPVTSNH